MADSADDILSQIKDPVIEQVGAELKKNYAKLSLLMEIGSPALNLAQNVTDDEFREMARKAISERKINVRFTNEETATTDITLEEINKRLNLLPAETKKELGIEHFNISKIIPSEETIKAVAETVHKTGEEINDSNASAVAVFFSALLKIVASFFGKGETMGFAEAKAAAASEHAQENIREKLVELSKENHLARNFLNSKTDGDKTVTDEIITGVPPVVYKNFGIDLPEDLKPAEKKKLIENTTIEKAPEINIDGHVQSLRQQVLYPAGKASLEEQIAAQILQRSQEKVKAAQVANDEASLFDKPKTFARMKIIEELSLKDGDADKMSEKLAGLIAKGVEDAVRDPKFASMTDKDAMIAMIADKISAQLEAHKNHDDMRIVKTVENGKLQKAISAAEFAGEKSDYLKGATGIGEMPPKIGENSYAVVMVADVRKDVIDGVKSRIDEQKLQELKMLSNIMVREQNNNPAISDEAKPHKPVQQSSANVMPDSVIEQAKQCSTHLGKAEDCSDIVAQAARPNNGRLAGDINVTV